MSDTERTRYDGASIRDGDWGKRCPEPNCPVCVIGKHEKRAHNKRRRREGKDEGDD